MTMQWVRLFLCILFLVSTLDGHRIEDPLSWDPAYISISFQKTHYFQDDYPVIRMHLGRDRAIGDFSLVFGAPSLEHILHPELVFHIGTSRVLNTYGAYYSQNNYWLNEVEVHSRYYSTSMKISMSMSQEVEYQIQHSNPAVEDRIVGSLYLDPDSALWETYAGYVITDHNLYLVRNDSYFQHLREFENVYTIHCDHWGSTTTNNGGACVMVNEDKIVVIVDFSSLAYVPDEIYNSQEVTYIKTRHGPPIPFPVRSEIEYTHNTVGNYVVLGTPFLSYFDEIAVDYRNNVVYLRTDTYASNTWMVFDILSVMNICAMSYLLLVSYTATHYSVPRYIQRYSTVNNEEDKLPLVGFGLRRVRYEMASYITGVFSLVIAPFNIPDGYLGVYLIYALFTVSQIIFGLYINFIVPNEFIKGIMSPGISDEDEDEMRGKDDNIPDNGDDDNSMYQTPSRSKLTPLDTFSPSLTPTGQDEYPNASFVNPVYRSVIRDLNHLMLIHFSIILLVIRMADFSIYLFLGIIVYMMIAFTGGYYMSAVSNVVYNYYQPAPWILSPQVWFFLLVEFIIFIGALSIGWSKIGIPLLYDASTSAYPRIVVSIYGILISTVSILLGCLQFFYDKYAVYKSRSTEGTKLKGD